MLGAGRDRMTREHQRWLLASIQTIKLINPVKKISRNPPSTNATVRSCSGFGLVMPKAPIKLSTRNIKNFIASLGPSIAPGGGGGTIIAGGGTIVRDQDLPNPAREELEKPHLTAEELEREIGDSEPWDEASEDVGRDAPRVPIAPR